MHTDNDTHTSKLYSLEGKVAVITGGGGFLGKVFALSVCEAGAVCILLDSNIEKLTEARSVLQSAGYRIYCVELSITRQKQIDEAISKIVKEFGKIDVLINSAALAMSDMQSGGATYFDAVEDYSRELWNNSLEINLTGTFMMCQRVGRQMRMQSSGSIINLASDVSIISPDHRIYNRNQETGYPGTDFNTPLSYTVTKTGILGMTRHLATYWASSGVRVNSLSPAGVYRDQNPQFVDELVSRIPLGRMALPHELKGPILFLASEASSFVTGSNLVVDGGRTIW